MIAASPTIRSTFRGYRVLVVEDEYMIAQEVVEMLTHAGAKTLGPVPSVEEAFRLIQSAERIDCALLDVNVADRAIWPAVDALRARGVPVVLATGLDASAIPSPYVDLPRCEKPAGEQDLARALARAMPSTEPR